MEETFQNRRMTKEETGSSIRVDHILDTKKCVGAESCITKTDTYTHQMEYEVRETLNSSDKKPPFSSKIVLSENDTESNENSVSDIHTIHSHLLNPYPQNDLNNLHLYAEKDEQGEKGDGNIRLSTNDHTLVPIDIGTSNQEQNNNMQSYNSQNQPQVIYVVQQPPPGGYGRQPIQGQQQQPVYIQQQYGQQQQQYGGPNQQSGGRPQQNPYQNNSDVINVIYVSKFEDPQVRRDFIRRTYTILCFQLLFFFGIISIPAFSEEARDWLEVNGYYIAAPCTGLYFVVIYIMCCAPQMLVQSPANKFVLVIITVSLTGLLLISCMEYKSSIVLMSIGVTMGLFIILTVFAFSCNYDFTKWMMVMMVVLIAAFFFALLAMILFVFLKPDGLKILDLVLGIVFSIIFSIYIVIDTQTLMDDKENHLEPDMEVFAAITLFLDIVNLFICILNIMGYIDSSD